MNRSTKWLVVFAAVLVAVAIGLSVLTASNRGAGRSLVFADGTHVTLLSAEVPVPAVAGPGGMPISMMKDRYDGGWRDWLYPKLPPKVLTKLGIRQTSAFGFATNAMGVWLKFQYPSGTPQNQDARCVQIDDVNGMESQDFWPGPGIGAQDVLAYYIIPNYPHRSSNVTVRVYHSDPKRPGEMTKDRLLFVLHNSAPATPPNWSAEPLPATRATNGLEITLTSLTTGLSNYSLNPAVVFTVQGRRKNSRAEFTFQEQGLPVTNWQVIELKCSAATGDSFTAFPLSQGWFQSHYAMVFPGALWSEEPAWDVTITVARERDFPAEEKWNIKGIPIVGSGDAGSNPGKIETNMYGMHLVFSASPMRGALGSSSMTVLLDHYSPDIKFALLSLQTDTGQTIQLQSTSTSIPMPRAGVAPTAAYGFDFNLPDGVTNLDATFTVSKLRTATFRVKPTLAP